MEAADEVNVAVGLALHTVAAKVGEDAEASRRHCLPLAPTAPAQSWVRTGDCQSFCWLRWVVGIPNSMTGTHVSLFLMMTNSSSRR